MGAVKIPLTSVFEELKNIAHNPNNLLIIDSLLTIFTLFIAF